jgi:hypothetical protein
MSLEQNNARVMQAARQFADAAEAFCAFVENEGDVLSPYHYARRSSHLLTALYGAALALPDTRDIAVSGESEAENAYDQAVSPEDVSKVAFKVGTKFEQYNFYLQMFDPIDSEDTSPVGGGLSDDFSGIYGDIKGGVVIFRQGSDEYVQQAIWEWKFGFDIHWGRHCISALRTLHQINSSYSLPE